MPEENTNVPKAPGKKYIALVPDKAQWFVTDDQDLVRKRIHLDGDTWRCIEPFLEKIAIDRTEVILFCPCCLASQDNGSWNQVVIDGFCSNCGASGPNNYLPEWAINSIREQASWVGKRYYPHAEDLETREELKLLRSLMPLSPGRSAEKSHSGEEENRWLVTQKKKDGSSVSTAVEALSEEEALEKSKTWLPYVGA